MQCVEENGPRPFVTRRVFQHEDGSVLTWRSRHHRKGLVHRELIEAARLFDLIVRGLWLPGELNWWIGVVFAFGASLFAVASLFALWPEVAPANVSVGLVYFAGSIPFTTAAYLQLYQAANAASVPGESEAPRQTAWLGWKPHDLGWLSCTLQFIGTLLFNMNTFDAMLPELGWQREDLLVWLPNILGSILFILSGYLAFIEVGHAYWRWKPGDLSWWVVFANLLGCVGFLVSAILAVGLPTVDPMREAAATWFTLIGAVCFFGGSFLMLPETVRD